jgi:hypothetical protein
LRTIPEGEPLPAIDVIHEAIWSTFALPLFDDVLPSGAATRVKYSDDCSRFFCLMYNAPPPTKYIQRDVRKRIAAPTRGKLNPRWRLHKNLVLNILQSSKVSLGHKALLAFAWDTLSRIGDIVSDPSMTTRFAPVPMGAMKLTRSKDAVTDAHVRVWSKTSKNYENITVSRRGYHYNPAGVDSLKHLSRYLAWRKETGATPSDPLWIDDAGKPIDNTRFTAMLRQFVPEHQRRHASGHCVRISAACELYANKLVGMDHLKELGRWVSASAMRRYLDHDVRGLLVSEVGVQPAAEL